MNYEKKYLKYKIKYLAMRDTLTNSLVNDNVENIIFTENKNKYVELRSNYSNKKEQIGGFFPINNDIEFISYVKILGFNLLFNLYLVNNDIRNALLIQPFNINEEKIKLIKEKLPNLIINTSSLHGIIISKKTYNDIIDEVELGTILEYPCASDFKWK